jgi:UDP-glucuronate decarboxylase
MVEAIIRLMETDDGFTGPINLGNAQEFTILELAELTIRMTNSRARLVRRPLPADDPVQRRPDTALAENELGWKASTPLDVGLRKTIEYFEQILRTGDLEST